MFSLSGVLFKSGRLKSPKSSKSSLGWDIIKFSIILKKLLYEIEGVFGGKLTQPTITFFEQLSSTEMRHNSKDLSTMLITVETR